MNVLIRKATIDDLEAILKLNKALFDYETAFNKEYNLGWTYSEKGKKYFSDRIKHDLSIVLVAEINKESLAIA